MRGLMQECDLDFPIMLSSSDGRVMDGMHRVCRALLDGRDAIEEAVRFVVDPKPDHVGVAPENLRYDDD